MVSGVLSIVKIANPLDRGKALSCGFNEGREWACVSAINTRLDHVRIMDVSKDLRDEILVLTSSMQLLSSSGLNRYSTLITSCSSDHFTDEVQQFNSINSIRTLNMYSLSVIHSCKKSSVSPEIRDYTSREIIPNVL